MVGISGAEVSNWTHFDGPCVCTGIGMIHLIIIHSSNTAVTVSIILLLLLLSLYLHAFDIYGFVTGILDFSVEYVQRKVL